MLLIDKLKNYHVILASQSPRRKELLKQLDINFSVRPAAINETYPATLKREEIPLYLSKAKALSITDHIIRPDTILIAADTIVWKNNRVMEKPLNKQEAFEILKTLSNDRHEVITGICLRKKDKISTFYSLTEVKFRQIDKAEINYYIEKYQPFDKAGAYGIQEWIGYCCVESISGSYNNVVGLPTSKLYEELIKFV